MKLLVRQLVELPHGTSERVHSLSLLTFKMSETEESICKAILSRLEGYELSEYEISKFGAEEEGVVYLDSVVSLEEKETGIWVIHICR